VTAPAPLTLGPEARAWLVGILGAGLIGAAAVYEPRKAAFAVVLVAVAIVVFRRLTLGVMAFVVLTFPADLPGSLGVGATVAKPLGVILALAWIAQVVAAHGNVRLLPRDYPALNWAIVTFVAVAACSAVWATDLALLEYEWKRLVQVAILLYVVYTTATSERSFRAIVWAYLAGSLLTAGYSILSGSYAAASGRLSGLFDPNTFAAELIPAICISALLLVTPRRARVRAVAGLVLGVDLLAFALTQSRGGLVGLGVALGAAIILGGRARPRLVVGILLLLAIAGSYYVEYAPAKVKSRLSNVSAQGSSGRSDEWNIAIRMFGDHPILGVGLGNYQAIEPDYAARSIDLQFVNYVVQDRLVAHNTYLEIAAELGLIGLAAFLGILGFTLVRATGALAQLERAGSDLEFYGRGLVIGMFGLLTAYTFFSAQYEKQLWLLLGLLAALSTLAATAEPEPRR